MAGRSGIFGQLGVATEETYGTYKAPSRFFPFESESLALDKTYIKSAGIRAGRLSQSQNLHRATTRTAGGDFSIDLFDQGMGILFNQLHGETVTPAKIASGTAYKQIHKIGTTDPYSKSMTVQVGRPDVGGTVRAFSYLGCKVTNMKISVDTGGIAVVTVTLDGQDEVTAETLGSATYDTDTLPYTFQQMVGKIGGSEVTNIRQIDINIAVGQNTERYTLGSSGKKNTPIINDQLAITADATLEFANLSDHERYTKEQVKELQLIGTGAEIESAVFFKNTFTMKAAKQVSSSPTVQGFDVLTQDVSFEIVDDGTNPPLELEVVSTDTTI